jgi:surfactin synthase thioesterase subunit
VPLTLPDARILAYGYDTRIRHRFQTPISQSTVCDFGQDLLVSLEAERRSEPSRPLAFVAHSLGGIIVKEALRRSNGFQTRQIHLHEIYKSTVAILFFGTPHSGADPRSFIHHIAGKVIRASGFAVNKEIVNTLLPNSDRLRELRDEFSPMVRQKKWIIYSFQEQYGVQLLNNNKVSKSLTCRRQ